MKSGSGSEVTDKRVRCFVCTVCRELPVGRDRDWKEDELVKVFRIPSMVL